MPILYAFPMPGRRHRSLRHWRPAGASPNAVALPDLTVYAPESQPYTSGFSPRGGTANTVRATDFQVWGGYDASVALHPYTSNIGPDPEAAPIQPSRYERAPFTD